MATTRSAAVSIKLEPQAHGEGDSRLPRRPENLALGDEQGAGVARRSPRGEHPSMRSPRLPPGASRRSARVLSLLALVAVVIALAPGMAAAQDTRPVQLSLFSPVQLQPERASIAGLRLSLFYTVNRNVTGADLLLAGLARTTGDFKGYGGAWIGVHWVDGNAIGWQSSLANLAYGGVSGAQTGVFNLARERSKGAQIGIVSFVETLSGAQVGFVNLADDVRGFQLGLVNVTRAMRGVQIGLVNIIREGKLPFMVIANANFGR